MSSKERDERSEKTKMMAGDHYFAFDPVLVDERNRAKDLCFRLNQISPLHTEKRKALIHQLIPSVGRNAWIESPFQVDYGYNLQVGQELLCESWMYHPGLQHY